MIKNPPSTSNYVIQTTEKSFCPNCQQNVDLLCKDFENVFPISPSFYVCWTCKQVFEVGKGRVRRETTP